MDTVCLGLALMYAIPLLKERGVRDGIALVVSIQALLNRYEKGLATDDTSCAATKHSE